MKDASASGSKYAVSESPSGSRTEQPAAKIRLGSEIIHEELQADFPGIMFTIRTVDLLSGVWWIIRAFEDPHNSLDMAADRDILEAARKIRMRISFKVLNSLG